MPLQTHNYMLSVPEFTTGCVALSLHNTTIRLLTMAAFLSSSNTTTFSLSSFFSAMSTMETAPSTIFSRAEMMAEACWRRNITAAISGAYAK